MQMGHIRREHSQAMDKAPADVTHGWMELSKPTIQFSAGLLDINS